MKNESDGHGSVAGCWNSPFGVWSATGGAFYDRELFTSKSSPRLAPQTHPAASGARRGGLFGTARAVPVRVRKNGERPRRAVQLRSCRRTTKGQSSRAGPATRARGRPAVERDLSAHDRPSRASRRNRNAAASEVTHSALCRVHRFEVTT